MGPPPFGDGNYVQHDKPGHPGWPSMGPPPFGDGNEGVGRVRNSIAGNGVLQWGHRLSAMETSLEVGEGQYAALQDRPSMGPPPFGDGNFTFTCIPTRPNPDLQWGHRLSAMETSASLKASAESPSLQWGHRLSAMETGGHGMTTRTEALVPSMGPPPFGDGNRQRPPWRWRATLPSMPPPFGDGNRSAPPVGRFRNLQWATAFRPSRCLCLQWGHRLSAMETRPRSVASPMGPPPFGDGNAGELRSS